MTVDVFEEYADRRNSIAFQIQEFIQEVPQLIAAKTAEKIMGSGEHEPTEELILEAVSDMVAEGYRVGEEALLNEMPSEEPELPPTHTEGAMKILYDWELKFINWYIGRRIRCRMKKRGGWQPA